MKSVFMRTVIVFIVSVALAGCTFIFQSGKRSDQEKITELSRQLDELQQAKRILEDRLSQEIKDKQVSLKMMEKGLVITFVADVLYDSGKASIRKESYDVLNKVARVLRENVPELKVGIEGHTDNQPIKFSTWKSNWELSTSRALSVLHFLISKGSLDPERLSAIGYGEYRPVATNDTTQGRQMNRRVEVVILPQMTKVQPGGAKQSAPQEASESQENLK